MVECQADRRVTDATGDNRDNIHNDCWVSLAQLQYRSGTISINLGGGGQNWLVPLYPPSIWNFRVKGLYSGNFV